MEIQALPDGVWAKLISWPPSAEGLTLKQTVRWPEQRISSSQQWSGDCSSCEGEVKEAMQETEKKWLLPFTGPMYITSWGQEEM